MVAYCQVPAILLLGTSKMTDEEKEKKGFVVNDRRRFDSEGNEKGDGNEAKPAMKASTPKPEENLSKPEIKPEIKPENKSEPLPEDGQEHGEMNFSSFIMSLATQALMQLGEIKPPPGVELEVDKNAARQTIDILGMLEQKTRNNLDKDEAHLFEQILHNLRLSYVKAVS